MSFSNAFRYPFQNLARVISVVLVLTIAFSIFISLMINSHDWSPLLAQLYGVDMLDTGMDEFQSLNGTTVLGLFGLLSVVIVSGFWLSGYSIEVIRAVMRDEEYLPGIALGRNLRDGFYLFVASIAYWVLFIAVIVFVSIVASFVGLSDGFGRFIAIASVPLIAAAVCLMGWGYFVGMARFAAEGDYRASWQIWRNMRIAKRHWGTGISLFLMMIAFSIIYGVVRGTVDSVLGGIAGGNLLAGITLSIIIYYVFNLMQHFSTQHLIAQYGLALELYEREMPGKEKLDYE